MERLGDWEAALQLEVENLQKRRDQVDAELQRTSKKLDLVRQMRLLEEGPAKPGATTITAHKDVRATPTAVREMAHKILSDATVPLHISEIHRQFKERGYAIPGGGTPFNILAHLVNDKAFVRVARGTYALAGSVPQELVLPKAPRKTGRRKRQKRLGLRISREEHKMQSKRGFDSANYLDLSQDHLVALALWFLIQDKKQSSFENLVAETFTSFPERFQLEGYPQWPNSHVIGKAWVRCRTDKKWITGSASQGFSLTPLGEQIARQVWRHCQGTGKVEKQPKDRKGSRQTISSRVVLRIENSTAYQKYKSQGIDSVL